MNRLPTINGHEVFHYFLENRIVSSSHTVSQKSKPSSFQTHPSVLPGIHGSCNSLKHVLDLSWGLRFVTNLCHCRSSRSSFISCEQPEIYLPRKGKDTVWSSVEKGRTRTRLQRQCLGCPPNVAELSKECFKIHKLAWNIYKSMVNCISIEVIVTIYEGDNLTFLFVQVSLWESIFNLQGRPMSN